MNRMFEDGIDFVDAIEDIKHQINFMSNACIALLSREDGGPIGDQSVSGLYVIFSGISDQLDELETAVHEKVFEVTEVVTREASAGKRSKHKNAPGSI